MITILGRASALAPADPFTAGDPIEVARLVRRALAQAGRKAFDVVGLVVVAGVEPDAASLARFARRALGPHGATLRPMARAAAELDHAGRCQAAADAAAVPGGEAASSAVIAVALGPDHEATALCLGSGLPSRTTTR